MPDGVSQRPLIAEFRLDRTVLSVHRVGEEPKDVEYWTTRSPEERIAAIESLRQQAYGADYAAAGLCRVLEIARREEG